MKYDILEKIGDEKLAIVITKLMRGENLDTVGQLIQEDWREVQDASPGALEWELTILQSAIIHGQTTIRDRDWERSPLKELSHLARCQKKRINWLHTKELRQGKPLSELTQAMKVYGNTLVALQEMRFDLGQDQYVRRPTTREQNEALMRQVAEAQDALVEIFKRREIRVTD
jgi:hypothetical protein